ncbi:ORF6N domain-containing protein [Victivallis sp. Marseille-Q1083]|uniref:ORF6N domain-containing protein n=1 Tax=Victivallis sp. Marseille-Q1083 TaxID=2717288 RepID=UPI00158DA83A|nr:ORF6N domain-containing protein [Victivallis sp. Marseille-Q1083]
MENALKKPDIRTVILSIRGENVILSQDLAVLFGVATKVFNQAVKRNAERFPEDFAFQLNQEEFVELVTNCDRFATLKHSSVAPWAFTEHGTVMAAMVLNSPLAIEMSIYVVRAFVALRRESSRYEELKKMISEMDRKLIHHDAAIQMIHDVLFPPVVNAPPQENTASRKIGFDSKKK